MTRLVTLAIAWIFFAGCAGQSRSLETESTLAMVPCQLEMPGVSRRIVAKCGSLEVLEDRSEAADPNGPRISLRIAVLEAVERNAAPDPLFVLTGGPGQAATESIVVLASAFRPIRRTRDIVLVDQRGTGGSNQFRCEDVPEDQNLDLESFSDEDLQEIVSKCVHEFGSEPKHYGSSSAAIDLDDVRDAMGYERVNLYGISYGTRMAATYATLFPARVRSIVLDGVVPSDEPVGRDASMDAQRALDLIFARCQGDPACSDRFGDLPQSFSTLIAKLESPVTVEIAHPRTGEPTTIEVDRRRAGLTVRLLSYSPETAALIPLLLSEADNGNYEPLAAQILIATSSLSESIADGMHYSVLCSEDIPFYDSLEEGGESYLGGIMTEELERVCAQWPVPPAPSEFKQALETDVPVLLLSGEADPVTPPSNAEEVSRGLSQARHLIAPGLGHGVVSRGCFPRLVAKFIERASVDQLSVECVEETKPLDFFVSYSGPPP